MEIPRISKGAPIKIVNISKDENYHTQINNRKVPLTSCFNTSNIMMLKSANDMFEVPAGIQPEDHLFSHILHGGNPSKEILALRTWLLSKTIEPQTSGSMEQWAINDLLGHEAVKFSTKWKSWDFYFSIVKKIGCTVIGDFPIVRRGRRVTLGHAVCLVGFSTWQTDVFSCDRPSEIDTRLIRSVFIDDPYGNYQSHYQDRGGNDVEIPRITFEKILRGDDYFGSRVGIIHKRGQL